MTALREYFSRCPDVIPGLACGASAEGIMRMYRPSPGNIFGVVLANARTHYPKRLSLRGAGATIPFIIKCG
ncbi:hypothetical protein, partial [Bradyrhizobium tropiciagri]|uniref:hypothetical protein n=1 Tax=Bradyrhizobium tropiciagri TaxID=312253 RepID=UPI001AEBC066